MGRRLTGYGIDSSAHDDLVAARASAEGLVAHADEDDGEEAEEEPGGGVDVPFLEDDAEVGRVPGEEHLHTLCLLAGSPIIITRGGRGALTFMLHMAGISCPPWPGMSCMSWPAIWCE